MEASLGNQLGNMKKILLCLIPLFLLSSCTKSEKDIVDDLRDYQDYAEFSLNSIDELYSKEEENYLVEIYFPECSHCKNIKSKIFDYIEAQKDDETLKKMYIFDIRSSSTQEGAKNREKFKVKPENYSEKRDILIDEMKVNKPSLLIDTYFFGTPSLYEIKNGSFLDLYIGETQIINYLSL